MGFQFIYSGFLSFALLATPSYGTQVDSEQQAVANSKQNNAQVTLMSRLAKTAFFSANFSQQVFDEQQNALQQSQGKLVVKKPTLVYWQTTQPDASLIVSDGDNLWFYDPFIEQATVYTVDASIANTPILLLTSTDPVLWQQYNISQQDSNRYIIDSKDVNSRVTRLTLEFVDDSPQLASFTILDSTGQTSVIRLTELDSSTAIDDKIFDFILPEGSYLDDQR